MGSFTIDPGQLRHRVTFQAYDGAVDAYGDPMPEDDAHWTPVATVSASIDALRGRDFFAAEQAQSEVTHKLICRYRAGITSAMRIVMGDRRFDIVPPVRDPEERHQYLVLMVKELVE